MKPLIVCELGAVETAEKVASGYAIACIPKNGNFTKTDYQDRKVILWPDATTESREAFKSFAEQINALTDEIKLIIPNGKPHGWNITAAVARDHMTWEQITSWAKTSMMVFGKGEFPALNVKAETSEAPDEVPAAARKLWEDLGLSMGPSGHAPVANVDNVVRILSRSHAFKDLVWFDEFYGRYFTVGPREWMDIDDINLTVKLQREFGFTRISVDTVAAGVRCRGHQCLRNEPREWIRSLRWDGKERIDRFFADYFGCSYSGYSAAVSRNFWLALIARVFQPGCQVDNMVILEGPQGIYKSKALETIGGKWYMEAAEEITSKDFFVALAGKLLVEIADLDSFSRADTTRIKKVITCRTDRYRQPYGRATQDHPRRSIFVGTTNETHYLRDATGARRFWPITCGNIALDRLRLDREQLYAEALTRYLTNEDWYRVPGDETAAEQEDRRQFDEWENITQEFLVGKSEITLTELAAYMGFEKSKIDISSQRRMGSILRRFHWKNKSIRRGASIIKAWVPQDDPEVVATVSVSPRPAVPPVAQSPVTA